MYAARSSEFNIQPSDIVAINPIVTGILVTVSCRQCGRQFQKLQPTVGGLAFGRYACGGCQRVYELWPEDFLAALDRWFSCCSDEPSFQIAKEGSHIARNWYRMSPLAETLSYKGINLGEPMERVLLSFIVTGLFKSQMASQEQM